MINFLSPETRYKLMMLFRRNTRKLRHIGGGMCLFAAIGPWLMVLKLVPTTYFLCFLVYISMVLGMGFTLIGVLYNNLIDNSQ